MKKSELMKRIEKGENIHTEFKKKLPDKEALAKSIVCFANTDGGQLIIGISEAGEIVGVEAENLDQTMRLVDDVAFNRCEPPVTVIQETVKMGDKTALVVNVPKGSQRPYRTGSGLYYIRSTNKCRQASREELLRLFQETESIYYDETTMFKAAYKDLDLDYFKDFLKRYIDITASEGELRIYLKNLKLMVNDRLTLSGVVFFAKKPQSFIPYAKIVAAYIPGTDISIPPADRKDIEGKISEVLDDAKRFLRLYLIEEHQIKGFESELKLEIPEAALREAVVNAIAHRDYTISAPIRLLIFKDRLEIRTPGQLPNTVTIESIKIGGAHVLRNPTIYNLLAKMGLVTDLGSGVRRIIYLVKEHLKKEVHLEETESEFVLTIPRK
jgi:ATP-dependent DNA helicase RecG